jgi:hypothetical protein
MHSDMIRLVAFDFILRLIFSGMMSVALVIRVLRMDFDNPAADLPGLGIPSDVITLFEMLSHLILERREAIDRGLPARKFGSKFEDLRHGTNVPQANIRTTSFEVVDYWLPI